MRLLSLWSHWFLRQWTSVDIVCLVARMECEEDSMAQAKEILMEHLANGWPGITKDMENICAKVGPENLYMQNIPKKVVKAM